jgi:hypothetical protein
MPAGASAQTVLPHQRDRPDAAVGHPHHEAEHRRGNACDQCRQERRRQEQPGLLI